MAKVTRLMAELPDDDDGPPIVEKVIPNLMAHVRLEHKMERLRRERDKKQEHLDQMINQNERRGRMFARSMRVAKQQEINELTNKIEEVIQKILELDEQA